MDVGGKSGGRPRQAKSGNAHASRKAAAPPPLMIVESNSNSTSDQRYSGTQAKKYSSACEGICYQHQTLMLLHDALPTAVGCGFEPGQQQQHLKRRDNRYKPESDAHFFNSLSYHNTHEPESDAHIFNSQSYPQQTQTKVRRAFLRFAVLLQQTQTMNTHICSELLLV